MITSQMSRSRLFAVILTLTVTVAPLVAAPPANRLAPAAHYIRTASDAAPADSDPSSLPAQPDPAMKARVIESYGKLPLSFEPNQGQTDPKVKFLARGSGYQLFLTESEAVLQLWEFDEMSRVEPSRIRRSKSSSVLRMKLVGANSEPRVEGQDELEGTSNYLIGNDRSKWHTDVPTFSKVRYEDVWPGIDLVWYGNQRTLEYDLVVMPGGDPSRIKIGFEGARRLRLDREGNLLIKTIACEITERAPVVYQDGEQGRKAITGHYTLKAGGDVAFEVGAFDPSKPLVIDPQLIYSTYLGGSGLDAANGVSVDGGGNAYIAGRTESINFPVNSVLAPHAVASLGAAFITKLNAGGTAMVYSTILGSDLVSDGALSGTQANGVAVTSDGKACITGFTDNPENDGNYPVTDNAYQKNGICLGAFCELLPVRFIDAFVTVLNSQGNGLIYSTFFGGSALFDSTGARSEDVGEAIAVDSSNRVYITGSSSSNNLPTKNAFQNSPRSSGGGKDAFIAVFNPALSNGNDTLLYASYLGGSGDDFGKGIAVDGSRNAYVVGGSASTDLETKAPAGQSLPPFRALYQGGATDAFAAKIDTGSSGSASLTYLTYIGGSSTDRAEAVAVDSAQRVYITGATSSSSTSFPLFNAFDTTQNNGEAFVAKLNADGTALFYSSFLGGTNDTSGRGGFETGTGIAIDSAGNSYVTGRTSAGATFPSGLVAPPFPANLQGTAFVAKIQASVSTASAPKLLYSTTFGGNGAKAESITLDSKGNVYLAGATTGGLPTTTGAFQEAFQGGSSDGFVAKIGSTFNDTIGVFRTSATDFLLRNSNSGGNPDLTVDFGLAGDVPIAGDWDGDGDDEPGVFRPSTGQFLLRETTVTLIRPCGACIPIPVIIATTITLNFGQLDDKPVVGDWDGDGVDTVGVVRRSGNQAIWLLSNSPNIDNSTPVVDIPQFTFGTRFDTPIVGDWNGDGLDTPGVLQNGQFVISNQLQTLDPSEVITFTLQGATGLPVAGDWDGDGVDTPGLFDNGVFFLRNSNTTGFADLVFSFGAAGDLPAAYGVAAVDPVGQRLRLLVASGGAGYPHQLRRRVSEIKALADQRPVWGAVCDCSARRRRNYRPGHRAATTEHEVQPRECLMPGGDGEGDGRFCTVRRRTNWEGVKTLMLARSTDERLIREQACADLT